MIPPKYFFLLLPGLLPCLGPAQTPLIPETSAIVQPLECGQLPTSPEVLRYLHDVVRKMPVDRNAGTTCIPLKIHIVRLNDGSGGISLTNVNKALANLNYYFFEAGTPMEFYLCDPVDYIDNTTWYDFNTGEEAALCDPNDVTNALNLYFVNKICLDAAETQCGIAGYAYFPSNNIQSTRLLLRNDQMILYANGTFVHEFGHTFSLEHTHQGTENGPNDSDAERVVRTPPDANCDAKSDGFCDTDADPRYNSSYFDTPTCTYTGNQTDDQGNVYTPPVDNIMSYYPDQCGGIFTAEQKTAQGQGLAARQSHTAYTLDCPAATVTNPSGLTATVTNNYTIQLSWTDNANNETGYLIERSTTSAASGFRALKFGGTGPDATTFEDDQLTANTNYWYRIKASNDNCNDYSNVVNINSGLLYCVPSVQSNNCSQADNSGNIIGIGIGRFKIDDTAGNTLLDNNNDACNGALSVYSSGYSANVDAGSTYNFTIELLSSNGDGTGSYFPQNYAIWIDTNRDGDFDDAGEMVAQSNINCAAPSPILTGSFTVPASAIAGTTTLRVRTQFCSDGIVSSPCAFYSFGEAEDYGLVVSSPLPVSWVSFAARQKEKDVLLEWKTGTEVNSSFFAVERSTDGYAFEEMGRVEAAGHSLQTLSYQFLDTHPLSGWLYYRLRQVDTDGSYTYSPVEVVHFDRERGLLRLYPNPSNGRFVLEAPAGTHPQRLELYDSQGRLLLRESMQGLSRELGGLLPGVYLVQLFTLEGRYVTKALVE